MNITLQETSALGREMTISIAADKVSKLMDQELQRLAGTISLPGFRPGKIPKQVLESRFREQLAAQIIEKLVQESFPEALKEKSLQPVDNAPTFDMGKVKRGEDFTYTATFEIYPDINPQGYTELNLTQRICTITEEDVDKVVQHIRNTHATYEANADNKAELGDKVILDYKGSVDGELFEGGQADGHELELGSNQFIPGFETQLLESVAGDEKQVKVSFPEDYRATNLAGKEALFECKIHEVRRRVLPAEDDALAKKAGLQTGGIAEMKVEVKKQLLEKSATECAQSIKTDILEQLLEKNPGIDVPEKSLKSEQQAMVAHAKREFESQGMDPAKMGLSDDQWAANYAKPAKDRLILGMVIGAIAEKENLSVNEADVQARLNEMVANYGDQAIRMKQWFLESEDRLDQVRTTVMEQLAIDWMIEHNTVTEHPCTFEELMKHANQ